jgi:hypothetical protein
MKKLRLIQWSPGMASTPSYGASGLNGVRQTLRREIRLPPNERDTDPDITKDYVRPTRRLGLIGQLRRWVGVRLIRLGTWILP